MDQPARNRTLVHLVNGTGHQDTAYFPPVELRDIRIELPREVRNVRAVGLGPVGVRRVRARVTARRPADAVRALHGGRPANPGAFHWRGQPLTLQPAAPRYTAKIVILLDEVSLSQAEYTAMALRAAPNATVVGSTTAGADGNVSTIPLPGGLRSMISGIGVFYPDKTPTQRVGIVPDIEAKPTIGGIRSGRDEVLEAALRHILGPDVPAAVIEQMAKR
jgi:hypothetical protein